MHKNGDNFTTLFTDALLDSTTVTDSVDAYEYVNPFVLMASIISDITANYIVSDYKADSLIVRDGSVVYQDYSAGKASYNRISFNEFTSTGKARQPETDQRKRHTAGGDQHARFRRSRSGGRHDRCTRALRQRQGVEDRRQSTRSESDGVLSFRRAEAIVVALREAYRGGGVIGKTM